MKASVILVGRGAPAPVEGEELVALLGPNVRPSHHRRLRRRYYEYIDRQLDQVEDMLESLRDFDS